MQAQKWLLLLEKCYTLGWLNFFTLVGKIFETYAKMVLINDDQCGIADIVLDVWLKVKKFNHPTIV